MPLAELVIGKGGIDDIEGLGLNAVLFGIYRVFFSEVADLCIVLPKGL